MHVFYMQHQGTWVCILSGYRCFQRYLTLLASVRAAACRQGVGGRRDGHLPCPVLDAFIIYKIIIILPRSLITRSLPWLQDP
jgi:hypothetical protein